MRALVTGGAGFIGSSLCEALAEREWKIAVLDNLSAGSKDNIAKLLNDSSEHRVELDVSDCRNPSSVKKALRDVDVVFHLAANPEVRMELNDPRECFTQNVYATHVLLETLREVKARTIVFASTSTVYGEATSLPTPEDYGPLKPISVYGASKLAGEALVSSYCHAFGRTGIILRLANVVGPRSRHGVVGDFIAKLRKNPAELEVLGDGTQSKSYVHIDDCIGAIMTAFETVKGSVDVFNIGSENKINVRTIAEIVFKEMGLTGTRLRFKGSPWGSRGWAGDVTQMLLDTTKLRSKGWEPKYDSFESVRRTVSSILKDED